MASSNHPPGQEGMPNLPKDAPSKCLWQILNFLKYFLFNRLLFFHPKKKKKLTMRGNSKPNSVRGSKKLFSCKTEKNKVYWGKNTDCTS